MIVVFVSAHYIGGSPLRVSKAQDHIGFKILSTLIMVYKVEVVAEKDGMLLNIACTEVQKLLRGAPEVWQLARESLVVLHQGDQGDESGCLINGVQIIPGLRFGVIHIQRWVLRSYVSA